MNRQTKVMLHHIQTLCYKLREDISELEEIAVEYEETGMCDLLTTNTKDWDEKIVFILDCTKEFI